MKYPEYQTDNSETNKYCPECRAKLGQMCSHNGSERFIGDEFCAECGHDLTYPKATPTIDQTQAQSYTTKFLADKIVGTRGSIE
jgi:hypothetical protein